MTEPNDEKKQSEMIKLVFDLLKHITTLASGSILLILAVAEKLFADKQIPKLLLAAPSLFIVSIVAALISMSVISFTSGPKGISKQEGSLFGWGFSISVFSFGAGMFFILVVLLTTYG